MTTIDTVRPPAQPSPVAAASGERVTLARVIRSEWIKLRSVRSTLLTLLFAAAAVAVSGVVVSILGDSGGVGDPQTDAASTSLFGTMIAQLVLGVLGALLITSEYSTGLIRATMTTVPKRLPVLWAKTIVMAGAAFVTMVGALLIAFFVGQAVYGGDGPGASITDPGVLRAVIGAAVFPTIIALMGVAFGALTRSTAGAVGGLVALLFIVPGLLQSLGGSWADLGAYLPGEAGQAMMTLVAAPEQLSPIGGLAVLACWAGVLLVLAAVSLRRRDA